MGDPSTICSTFGGGASIGPPEKSSLEAQNAALATPEIAAQHGEGQKKESFAKDRRKAFLHCKTRALEAILPSKSGSVPKGPLQRPKNAQNARNAIPRGAPRRPPRGGEFFQSLDSMHFLQCSRTTNTLRVERNAQKRRRGPKGVIAARHAFRYVFYHVNRAPRA